jgi:hypothetical protein
MTGKDLSDRLWDAKRVDIIIGATRMGKATIFV